MIKKLKSTMPIALLTALSMQSPVLLAAGNHSHSHGDEAEFEATETEFGKYSPNMKASRIVEVSMSDEMRFTPDTFKVKKDEVIEFKVTNNGKLMHEFVLGTPSSLDEHAEMMKKFPGMEHEEPYMAHVAPGKSASVTWQFSKPGEYSFGCLIPGHYDAGMKGQVMSEI